MASLDLPVETRMASFSRFAGMSLAAGVTRLTIPVGSAVSGVASNSCITSFKASCSCAVSIYVFLDFNNPLYIRQKGLQLPDNPRHGVRHSIQSQGVAVEQHVAQIFLTRGFDNFVLRLKGVCAKPVQKLSKHGKLVEAGWRVHGPYICVSYKLVIGFVGQGFDVLPRQPPGGVGVKFI